MELIDKNRLHKNLDNLCTEEDCDTCHFLDGVHCKMKSAIVDAPIVDTNKLIKELKQSHDDMYRDCQKAERKAAELELEVLCLKEALYDSQFITHAHWIHDTYEPPKCSNCGVYSPFDENYCASCGAKMDEKEE